MGDKKKLGFFENFMLSGVAAAVSKTAAAPIERVKLLVQNQDEMIKQGRLAEPYKGVVDCVQKTLRTEGVLPFWRGNLFFNAIFYVCRHFQGPLTRTFDYFQHFLWYFQFIWICDVFMNLRIMWQFVNAFFLKITFLILNINTKICANWLFLHSVTVLLLIFFIYVNE